MDKIEPGQPMKIIPFIIPILCLLSLTLVNTTYSHTPVAARNGMVVSASQLASDVGIHILQQGGNAVDAAVAVAYMLAVSYPQAGNIGGGGFMLIRLADGAVTAIDYRETAPLQATANMYLDTEGEIIPEASLRGAKSAGIPGTVAGLELALSQYGTMKRKTVMQPAIELARKGFPVNYSMSQDLENLAKDFKKYPSTAKIFSKNGLPYQLGDTVRQPDLANTLEQIAATGAAAFYQGPIAGLIEQVMKIDGGLITMQDLALYTPVIRQPLISDYRGYTIYTMPPPTSGGIILIGILKALEANNLTQLGHNSSAFIHQFAEISNRYFADRAFFMGDPDFVNVPVSGLTSREYAQKIRQAVNPDHHIPSLEILHGDSLWLAQYAAQQQESDETTHFSVIDHWGNAVSNTYTLNDFFGSHYVIEGTGILLNDEMDDFSIKQGTPNIYGLVGGNANAIQPRKRMLSSMSPTIISKDGELFMVLGSPGGSKIITSVCQVILNVIDHKMNIQDAVIAPRVHSQWLPDELVIEPLSLSTDVINNLTLKGHTIRKGSFMGEVQAILLDSKRGMLFGAIDLRHGSSAVSGY
jgi:gamma-glutamyltranspeptidase/glutathione hydrolase